MTITQLPPNTAINLDRISVRYRIPIHRVGSFKEYMIRSIQGKIKYQDFWAIKNVSMEISKGDSFGLIGRNGAGKSTLLKVISRVLAPSTGRIRIQGRISPLLELGAGFHPELTGLENIFLNGALLGHSRIEIRDNLEEILDFAQIGAFINSPLRTYSNGMIARLGFSVATTWKPDILILDEILAVGDEAFREKCYQRIISYQNSGTTIILVTHDLTTMANLCKKAAWLKDGEIKLLSDVTEVVDAYRKYE